MRLARDALQQQSPLGGPAPGRGACPEPTVAHGVVHRPAPDYCNDHHTGPSHSIGHRAQHVFMHIVLGAHCVHCVSGKGTQVLCIIAHIMPAIRVHIVLLCIRQGNASSLSVWFSCVSGKGTQVLCPYVVVYQPSSTSFVGVNGWIPNCISVRCRRNCINVAAVAVAAVAAALSAPVATRTPSADSVTARSVDVSAGEGQPKSAGPKKAPSSPFDP